MQYFRRGGRRAFRRTALGLTVLVLSTALEGCITLIDTGSGVPSLAIYGRAASGPQQFHIVRTASPLLRDAVLGIADPGASLRYGRTPVHAIELGTDSHLVHTVPRSHRPKQRAYFWLGAMVPVSPKFGGDDPDHILLLWQPEGSTLYRIDQDGRRARTFEMDLSAVRTRLAQHMAARESDGIAPETPLFENGDGAQQFWSDLTWEKSKGLRVESVRRAGDQYKLELVFSMSPSPRRG